MDGADEALRVGAAEERRRSASHTLSDASRVPALPQLVKSHRAGGDAKSARGRRSRSELPHVRPDVGAERGPGGAPEASLVLPSLPGLGAGETKLLHQQSRETFYRGGRDRRASGHSTSTLSTRRCVIPSHPTPPSVSSPRFRSASGACVRCQ